MSTETTKVCTKCMAGKSLHEFALRFDGKYSWRSGSCMECLRATARSNYYKNHDRNRRNNKNYKRRHRYELAANRTAKYKSDVVFRRRVLMWNSHSRRRRGAMSMPEYRFHLRVAKSVSPAGVKKRLHRRRDIELCAKWYVAQTVSQRRARPSDAPAMLLPLKREQMRFSRKLREVTKKEQNEKHQRTTRRAGARLLAAQ
jgi:hypothetical protein